MNFTLTPARLRPWLSSISTGVLLALSFPKPGLSFFAWVALLPLLLSLSGAHRLRRAFALAYLSGFIFFAATHYWVRPVMTVYGGLPGFAAIGVYLAFAALMAVYFGLFGALGWLILRLPDRHILWGIPALWVGIELLRSHALTGLPFLLLGYALADHVLLAQLASMGGVYLLSFVVVIFNTGLLLLARNPSRSRGYTVAAAFIALAAASIGGTLLPDSPARRPVYIVQALADIDHDWTPGEVNKLFQNIELRLMAVYARNESQPGLIVWPEIPVSLYYYDDELIRERLRHMARQTASSVLVNVIAFADSERTRPLNSAVLIGPDGNLVGRYAKNHLVPFGEYVPYQGLFFFAGTLTRQVGDFVAGTGTEPLGSAEAVFPALRPMAPLICYEGIFPELVRGFAAKGAQVLVNISNDGWYGESAAREQLLLMSRMRAVENGRWLIRATNTGISAIVDPYGRITTFPPSERNVFVARYELLRGKTIYVLFGHWFALAAAIASLALAAFATRSKVRSPRPSTTS